MLQSDVRCRAEVNFHMLKSSGVLLMVSVETGFCVSASFVFSGWGRGPLHWGSGFSMGGGSSHEGGRALAERFTPAKTSFKEEH